MHLPLTATLGPVQYALVGVDLADVVAGTYPEGTADPLTRQEVPVRVRRAALLLRVNQAPAVRVVVLGNVALSRQ